MAIDNYPAPRLPISNAMWMYNATGGETTLSGYDSKGQPLQYTVNSEQLFLNGVMLVRGVDYAATTGTTITGLVALSAGDFVEILTYSNFNISTLPAPNITGKVLNNQLDKSSITLGSNTVSLGDTVSSLSGLNIDFNSNTFHMARGATNPSSGVLAGDLFWNTTTNAMQVYNGTAWTSFSPPAAPTIGSATDIGTGRAYNNAAASVSFTPNITAGAATSFFITSNPGSLTAYGTTSPITITGLASSTQYTFTATAVGSFGNSNSSNASGALTVTSVPQAPTVGTPTASLAVVTIPFTAGATGGSTITSYTITSSSGRTAAGVSSPLSITELSSGTYTYSVTATNANGTSVASSNSIGVVVSIPTVTGGISASDATYNYRVFTTSGSLGVSGFSTPLTADLLVIAGGGGGGEGGGGAGGVLYSAAQTVATGTYNVNVGGGGTGSTNGNTAASNGTLSSITSLTSNAIGGGAGGTTGGSPNGAAGGSGGGGRRDGGGTGGAGTSGQGNAGGSTPSMPWGGAAGGGGAGAAGGAGSGGVQSSETGGAGGSGTNSYASWITAITNAMQSVSGWSTATATGYIAGGGGGGVEGTGTRGPAGVGGGGAGALNNTTAAVAGTTNTGGGGGGRSTQLGTGTAGAGGAGLIVVRWTKAQGG